MDQLTRFMIDTFDQSALVSVPLGFQAWFGVPGIGRTTFSPDKSTISIDIIKGNLETAALIPRGGISRTLGTKQRNLRTGRFTNIERQFPLTEEEGDITANELLTRLPGEPQDGSSVARIDRLREKAVNIHHDSVRRTIRTFEILASQSVLTGKHDAIFGTTDAGLQYDFYRDPTHDITVSVKWSTGTADVIGDLDFACKKIDSNGLVTPDMLLLGAGALKNFLRDTAVRAYADNRRFEYVRMGRDNQPPASYQRFIDAGFLPQGSIRTEEGYDLWVFTYRKEYIHPTTGLQTKYLPDDLAVVGVSTARCDRHFGPPEMLPVMPAKRALYAELLGFDLSTPMMPPQLTDRSGIILPGMFYADAYTDERNSKLSLRTQSAPIFATTQTNAFAVLHTEQ